MFHVLEAPTGARGNAEVELLHVLVRGELRRDPIHDDPATLEDVAVVGVTQRDAGVLFGEQKTDLLILVEAPDDAEDLLEVS